MTPPLIDLKQSQTAFELSRNGSHVRSASGDAKTEFKASELELPKV